MTRRIKDIHEEALVADVLHDQGDGRCLDTEASLPFREQGVCVPHWDVLFGSG